MQNFPRYIWEHLQADTEAFCFRYLDDNQRVQPYSYREWTRHIQRVAVSLREEGFEPGTRVGFVSPISRGWLDLAFGVWLAGGCVVPVNHSLERRRVLSCLGRAGCDWVAVADAESRSWLRGQGEGLPPSLQWVLLDPESQPAGDAVTPLAELDEQGRSLVARGKLEDLAEAVFPISAEAPAAVLFEGTPNDDPHGAMYQGATLGRLLDHLAVTLNASSDDTTAIVAEPGRPEVFLMTIALGLKGSPLAVGEAPKLLDEALEALSPTRMVCGEEFLRRRTQKWRKKLQESPEFMQEGSGADTNADHSTAAADTESFGLGSLLDNVGASAAERLVYRPLRRSLGGQLETVVVAGPQLSEEVERIVEKAGAAVLDQFSLPECGISHLERPENRRRGLVGKPIDGVRCKIDAAGESDDESGEILIKSDALFDDYWDRTGPRQIRQGWLRTGIEGEIVDGALKIIRQ